MIGFARSLPALVILPLVACSGLGGCSGVAEPPVDPGDPLVARGQPDGGSGADASAPAADFRASSLTYPGPGGEEPEATNATEVRIGWFAPADSRDLITGGMWIAASLAVEEANRAGGYRGLPFRLVAAWSGSPWGTGAADVTRLVYADDVLAILGSVDGPATHIAEQVVAKARLSLVSAASTDKSVNLAGVPWMFSCAPGDHLWTSVFVRDLLASLAASGGEFVLLRATDHDSRLAATEVLAEVGRRERAPAMVLDFHPGETGFADIGGALDDLRPDAVVLIAGPADSARAVQALRQRGLEVPVHASPQAGRTSFAALAGAAAEGVRFPLLTALPANLGATAEFRRAFAERAGVPPDYTAAFSYDATRIVIAAVHSAGLNRARIREAIASLSPWEGVGGEIRWDGTGQSSRVVERLATIRNGRVEADE